MPDFIPPRVLKGFRDSLPDTEIDRKNLTESLEKTFRSFGFVPIDTPALEYAEILLRKSEGETEKQVYRFLDHGGRDVALRFDLTVPFARFMAEHWNELYLPFKRYHIAKVWRGENTQRGRYREFSQCDFDIVGSDSAASDLEILLLIKASMEILGVPRFRIRLSHRGIFNRFLDGLGLRENSVEILRLVDKYGKIGAKEVLSLLSASIGVEKSEKILAFIKAEGDFLSTLAAMERASGGESEASLRLRTIHAFIKELGVEGNFILDPSITRGLDYYTGIVYETFLSDIPEIGSVCSGGRYDDLASLYTKEKLPGVGASIGLDRLLSAMETTGRKGKKSAYTELMIFSLDESLSGYYQGLAQAFRSSGISAEVFLEKRKLPAQFAYAEKKSIGWGILCGTEEKTSGRLSLRNLETRETRDGLAIDEAIGIIRNGH